MVFFSILILDPQFMRTSQSSPKASLNDTHLYGVQEIPSLPGCTCRGVAHTQRFLPIVVPHRTRKSEKTWYKKFSI